MSEAESKTEAPAAAAAAEDKTAEELKGTKRAAEVRDNTTFITAISWSVAS